MRRRQFLQLALGALLGAGVGLQAPAATAAEAVWRAGARENPFVALTYDDCVDYTALSALEQVLAAHPAVRVTFFPTGVGLLHTAKQDPLIWPRLVEAGHTVGYHTFRHNRVGEMTAEALATDLADWQATLNRILATRYSTQFARPPYGEFTAGFADLCAQNGLTVAGWSRVWSYATQEAQAATAALRNGDIVLLHADKADVVKSRLALPWLVRRCLTAVTLEDLRALSRQTLPAPPTCPAAPPAQIA